MCDAGSRPRLTYDHRGAVERLRAADPALAKVIDAVGPFELRPQGTPYESLFRAILYQQLAGTAARAIERRVLDLFGGAIPAPPELLKADEESLRKAGLSRQKIRYLKDLAQKALEGLLGPGLASLSDDEVVRRVTSVKGIGRWTAEMLLMFCLGRPDVFPADDLGVRKGIQRVYGLPGVPTQKEARAIAERWRPYRSVATWYLWRAARAITMEDDREAVE
ncbi:MAG TPA: DNA-3-methyladenine glycosylase [Dehalococcoidia bacterium]|nr:DNA-3-methyladenine glycosylase [Dehalococcoidia bacterium]